MWRWSNWLASISRGTLLRPIVRARRILWLCHVGNQSTERTQQIKLRILVQNLQNYESVIDVSP